MRNDQFLALGLRPTLLSEGLLTEVREVAGRYAHRADLRKIISRSVWRAGMASPATWWCRSRGADRLPGSRGTVDAVRLTAGFPAKATQIPANCRSLVIRCMGLRGRGEG